MESNVYNIDCIEYMRTLPDKAFQLAIVDPPYGLNRKSTKGAGKLKKRVLNTSDISKRWDIAPSKEYFDELRRVSENQIIWGGNYFDLPPCRCFICWDKCQPWPNFSQAEFAWTSFDKPAKMFRHTSRINGKWHPTTKPVELYAFLLRTFAKEGDRILDTHMGSQSSRIAAHKLGFDYVGCEIDKEYFDKGCEWFMKECQILPQLL
jgi:site-specific DNA-methyltransferase (adenine-specific)